MSLGLSAPCLDPVGRTPWATTWILGLGDEIHMFLPGSPKARQLSNCLQRHPIAVCFLLPELACSLLQNLASQGLAHHSSLGAHGRCQVPSS